MAKPELDALVNARVQYKQKQADRLQAAKLGITPPK